MALTQRRMTRLDVRHCWLIPALAGLLLAVLVAPLSSASASVDVELAFHRGVAAFGNGEYDVARREFEIVLAEDPEDSVVLQYLGMIDQEQGDLAAAVEKLTRATKLDPENTDARVGLAAALIQQERRAEAAAELARVIEIEPDRAEAYLYLGIIDYREREYESAVGPLKEALALDPDLELEASYYLGLAQALRGDLDASAGAFAVAQQTEPSHPLGRSAAALKEQVDERRPRIWGLSLTGGLEFDSSVPVPGQDAQESEDGRGIIRVRANVRALEKKRGNLDFGYDGYLGLYFQETELHQQTHLGWVAGSLLAGPVRLTTRYDYSFTTIDLADKFRHLHRLTPGAAIATGDWGVAQAYYQLQYMNYLQPFDSDQDPDGVYHSAGLNEFVFLPAPLSYARIGGRGLFYFPQGKELEFKGFELSGGGGLDLPLDAQLELLYVFQFRNYSSDSTVPTTPKKRRDRSHLITLECSLPLARGFDVSVAASFTFNGSNISTFDYNRQVVGSYLTYQF